MAKAKSRHAEELPLDIPEEALEVDSDIPLSDLEATKLANAARASTRGPLSTLIPVFVDVETYVNAAMGITLRSQTLRQYLAASHLTAIAIGIGDDPIELFYPETEQGLPDGVNKIDARLIAVLKMLAADPRYVFVAHNAAFDMRVLRILLGIPHPVNVWCTLEGSMGAWPELPGGFSLKNVSKKLQLPKALRKLDIDLDELTKLQVKASFSAKPIKIGDLRESVVQWINEIAEIGKLKERGLWDGVTITVELTHRLLGIYNVRDVEAMRAIYWRQATRIGPPEQEIALLTHRQRKNFFHINQERLDALIVQLDQNAEYAEKMAGEYLTVDQKKDIFNRGEDGKGPLRSLRYTRLKNVVNDSLASETFTTVSAKKVSPVQLARNPTVRAVLEQTSRVGKMLSHRRRSAVFNGVDVVDLELGYARAHTMRFSSPSSGRGLNLHNCIPSTSLIATSRGWVPLAELRADEWVWDSVAFVQFAEVTFEGNRDDCVTVGGLTATPEHPVCVSAKRSLPIGALRGNPRMRRVAIRHGFAAVTAYQAALAKGTAKVGHAADGSAMPTGVFGPSAVFDLRGVGRRARFLTNGLVILNCPKHDKAVAEPVRRMFRFSDDLCIVRGDLANVEYRCIEAGTPVLTDSGWKPIERILSIDKVWDGVEFVSHKGVVCQGDRQVIDVHGVGMTPDHPVLSQEGWVRGDLAATLAFQTLAPSMVAGPSLAPDAKPSGDGGIATSPVSAAQLPKCPILTSSEECQGSAAAAPPSAAGATSASSPMKPSGSTGSMFTRTSCPGATILPAPATPTMGRVGSPSIPPSTNAALGSSSSATTLIPPASTSPSTGSTPTGTTCPGTSDSQPWQSRMPTGAPRRARVYDLIDCGPRRQFVVGAGDRAFIVHNCEGYLTGCKTVIDMFNPAVGGNINNDPYMLAWKAMTGATIKDKKDPVRQVSKSAVLGLGYAMASTGYAKVLLTALSDPGSGVTEDLLRQTILESGWGRPDGGQIEQIIEKLGCSQVVALAAFHINRVFNEAHPEFKQTAYWLVDVVKSIASCGTGSIGRDAAREAIELAYAKSTAPDRNLINLFIDDDPLPRYPSIRVACGHWGPTVCWREPYMRRNPFDPEDRGPRLTIRKSAGRVGTFKSFSPQLAIENVTQAAARNALCMGLLKLKSRGFMDVIHVHDEIMIICKRDRDSVLAARDALLWAFGPKHDMPYAWSILVKPEEVTVTQSLFEDEDDIAEFITKKDPTDPKKKKLILGADGKPAKFPGGHRWHKIEQNLPGCLDNLP